MRVRCALISTLAVGACASQRTEASDRLSDTTGRRDSIAAVAAASMDEPQVIGLLEHVHASDSALGSLGAIQGSTREIKDFGLMISREHHALRRDAQQIAVGLRIAPQPPGAAPDEPPSMYRETLNDAQAGPMWDRVYVDYAVAVHDAALENTARALAATKSPATKEYIRKSVPILQKHLDKARSLQKSLSQSQTAAAATKP